MGNKRKKGEISERGELEELRSETVVKSDKTRQKRKRDQQLDSSQEIEPKDEEKQREKKRKKKEESICYLPGQVHETPKERDPLRVFLESLYQQLPEDELIRGWMLEWGLLPREEAMKVLEKVNEKDVVSEGTGKAKTKLKKKKVRLSVG